MEILSAIIVQTICILLSTAILWGCIKLFDREIHFFTLLIITAIATVIQVTALFFKDTFSLLLIFYILSLAVYYWGIYKYSSIKSFTGCFLIVLAANAMETGLGKLISIFTF